MTERIAAATVHGRYLVIPPAALDSAPILVGFLGYAESAETQMERLTSIPDSNHWLKVSIQALHPFYQRRANLVVANWMTRQDREHAIADNIAYVKTCIDAVAAEWATLPAIVFAGFSQGVAMAYRAAVHTAHGVAGVISVGGDIPPEITPGELARLSSVLIVRGVSDEWYTGEQFANDEQRLRQCQVNVHALSLSAGHEWSADVTEAASHFLAAVPK